MAEVGRRVEEARWIAAARARELERQREREQQQEEEEARNAAAAAAERARRDVPRGEPPQTVDAQRAVSPRALAAAAAFLVVVGGGLWLALSRPKQPPAAAVSPVTQAAPRTEPSRGAPASSSRAATPAAGPPASSEPAAPPPSAAPADAPAPVVESAVAPPAATSGTSVPAADEPNEAVLSDFRTRVQALLARRDLERALSVLNEGFAYASADKALIALAAVALEQAQTRAADERTKAVARGASAQVKFKEADRSLLQARQLSRERKVTDSAKAFLRAATLFATTTPAPGAARSGAAAPAGAASPAVEPEPPPARAARREPEPSPPPAPKTAVDPVVEAFVSALSRGDRAAMLAVFPAAPADLLASLGKRPAGSMLRITDLRVVSDSRGYPGVVVTVESIAASGARDPRLQQLVLALEPRGDSWKVVSSRWR
jgi:hypothetical protein